MQVYAPLEIVPIAGDIASPNDGFVWYNSTSNKFRCREGGTTKDLVGGGGGSSSLSGLTAGTASNTIDNANYAQEWQWNSLAGTVGFKLSSTSTAAASNAQKLFQIALSGANTNSSQTTYAVEITNSHTGTSSVNVALKLSASGGSSNYALIATGYVGVNTSSPLSALQVSFDQNTVSQSDANGIFLSNGTAATNGTQSISPPLVLGGKGWSTTNSLSMDVRFRQEVLPIQAGTPAGSWRLLYSVNGAAYSTAMSFSSVQGLDVQSSLTASGTATFNGDIVKGNFRAGGNNIYQSSQILAGLADTSTQLYKHTNAGTTIVPRLVVWSNNTTAGIHGVVFDPLNSNGIVFTAGNGSINHVARANITITNLTNTAGSEAADIVINLQNAGAGLTEKVRIANSLMTVATSLYINGAFASYSANALQSNLYVSGSNRISSSDSSAWYQISGSSNAQYRTGFYGNSNDTLSANTSYASVLFGKAPVTIAATGTHGVLSNVAINGLAITSGAGAVSKVATVYIDGAATGAPDAKTNYALYINAGDSYTEGFIIQKNHKRLTSVFNKTDSTLADVTGLTGTLLAGGVYRFRAMLHVNPDNTGGYKCCISGSCTATSIVYHTLVIDNTSATIKGSNSYTALNGTSSGNGTTTAIITMEGTIVVNAAGTIVVQFAQNSASGTSSVLDNSTFEIERIL